MKKYFETAIRHLKTMEDGSQKRVTDCLLVDAMSFTEAEVMTLKYANDYGLQEPTVIREKATTFSEVIDPRSDSEGVFYKAKVRFLYIDEKSGKEKYTTSYYCVYADSTAEAIDRINEYMKTSMSDYEVSGITATNITDIVEHEKENIQNKDSGNG